MERTDQIGAYCVQARKRSNTYPLVGINITALSILNQIKLSLGRRTMDQSSKYLCMADLVAFKYMH